MEKKNREEQVLENLDKKLNANKDLERERGSDRRSDRSQYYDKS